jgi:hypothetical protein
MDDTPAALIAEGAKADSLPIGKPITVEPLHWLLLNEAPIKLTPKLADKYGLAEAIFLGQLIFWLTKSKQGKKQKFVRFSYTRWQRQFPFWTRRYLIEIVKGLEKQEVIKVIRDGGVNRIEIGAKMDWGVFNKSESNLFADAHQAALPVLPTLATVVGLREAIILQQVHIRSRGDPKDWTGWAQKSAQQWHDHCLMFIGVRTLERLFPKLVKDELLIAKRVSDRGFGRHAHRCNYDKLKALMMDQTTHGKVIDWKKTWWLKKGIKEKGISPMTTSTKTFGPVQYE